MDAVQLAQRTIEFQTEVKGHLADTIAKQNELANRLTDVEQKTARRGAGGGTYVPQTWGASVIQSDEFKSYAAAGGRGLCRVEVKAISSASNSGGPLITPDRDQEVITLPRRRMTVAALISQGETTSNSIQVMRELVYTNNAAPVPEMALKPESNITYELLTVPVKTIAHWVPVSRQAMDDAPQLQSLIDGALTWGLEAEEELQILLGTGTGEDLLGLVPQATAFSAPFAISGATAADVLLQAIAQAELAELPATGIVLNTGDWAQMMALKATDGTYLGGGPWGVQQPRMWGLPVVATTAMPAGSFLVGNFSQAARLYRRMNAEVLISQDHADFFVKNLLAVRCESRISLAVIRPQSLIAGTFPD